MEIQEGQIRTAHEIRPHSPNWSQQTRSTTKNDTQRCGETNSSSVELKTKARQKSRKPNWEEAKTYHLNSIVEAPQKRQRNAKGIEQVDRESCELNSHTWRPEKPGQSMGRWAHRRAANKPHQGVATSIQIRSARNCQRSWTHP